jgi:hypothetical protein
VARKLQVERHRDSRLRGRINASIHATSFVDGVRAKTQVHQPGEEADREFLAWLAYSTTT